MKLPQDLLPGFIAIISGWFVLLLPSAAQIIPDSTLPVNSVVTPNENIWEITGGSQAGGNLFHSFEQFSVPTGTAFFNHSLDIENIFSRVTGGSVSEIDGLIRANGAANLFLLNPNGIMFGPNARLDIGGSFFASTADRIHFADGSFFSVTETEASPILTINVPVGLQLGPNPGTISNQSRFSVTTVIDEEPVEQIIGLQVQPGKTLALVGGNVALDGGYVTAPGGRIELGSLGEPGTVGLNQDGSLSFPDAIARGDILLTNGAEVNVRAATGGDIAIHGGNFQTLQGSTVKAGIASGLGSVDSQAGDIEINATENVTISNTGSFISNAVLFDSIGNSGAINITAANLLIAGGGFIKASTFGRGNAGNMNINVRDTVSFDDRDGDGIVYSGVYSRTENEDTVGNGGNIEIAAGSLLVTNGAVITTSTEGRGDAGDITINVRDRILLDDLGPYNAIIDAQLSSGIFSSVKLTGVGNGGQIRITTGSLEVRNSGVVIARTEGQGNAGSILIDAAESVIIAGIGEDLSSSGLLTPTQPEGNGIGGDIIINTDIFRVSDGAVVNSQTLNANPGGDITINARVFEATNGGQVLASTTSSGKAGDLTINATEEIIFSGRDPDFARRAELFGTNIVGNNEGDVSGTFASTGEESTGPGGNLTLQTRQLNVRDGGTISVTAAGVGAAGSVIIDASSIRLQNGNLTAETSQGDFGDIQIRADDIQLRENSRITTNAGSGTGGNITITTQVIAGLENSDITADADGQGGQITINFRGLFGLQERTRQELQSLLGEELTVNSPNQLPSSDITAFSVQSPELNGNIVFNTPQIDPTSGLWTLSEELLDVVNLINQDPCIQGIESQFIVTGSGGLPAGVRDSLSGDAIWPDIRSPMRQAGELQQPIATVVASNSVQPIIEATDWVVGADGQIILVAEPSNASVYAWGTPQTCQRRNDRP